VLESSRKTNFGFYLQFLQISNAKLGLGYSLIGTFAWFLKSEIGVKKIATQ
jgi:hypothetical protein